MRRAVSVIALLGAVVAMAAVAAAPAAAARVGASLADSEAVSVELSETAATAGPGEKVSFESTVRNTGDRPLPELIAHLNILSSDPDVYVDPEDWSSERTVELPRLRPGGTRSLSWDLQAVNAGRFAVYVVVLPKDPAAAGKTPLVVSPPMQVDVAGRRTLNVGGALPVVVATPVLLGLLAVNARRRVRRTG